MRLPRPFSARNDKTEILKQVERDIALQCLLIVDSRMTG